MSPLEHKKSVENEVQKVSISLDNYAIFSLTQRGKIVYGYEISKEICSFLLSESEKKKLGVDMSQYFLGLKKVDKECKKNLFEMYSFFDIVLLFGKYMSSGRDIFATDILIQDIKSGISLGKNDILYFELTEFGKLLFYENPKALSPLSVSDFFSVFGDLHEEELRLIFVGGKIEKFQITHLPITNLKESVSSNALEFTQNNRLNSEEKKEGF